MIADVMIPRLEVDPEEGLLVEWTDGHQSRFPFGVLRDLCPCAECRDEKRPRPGRLKVLGGTPESRPAAGRLVRCDRIGNYAIGLVWGDGHNSGIYSWEYLRGNCGCIGCRLARGGEDG